jgi:5'-methylthioadenosine phosphorylase
VRPIGILGGTGLYALLDDAVREDVSTPFGAPSAALARGRVGDREVVFLPRHGADHRFPPHRVPYRANLWALRAAGVRQVLAPCAVGGLDPALAPGDLVVPDQVLDRTSGRERTFWDEGAVHVPFADPYCPRGRVAVLAAATDAGWPARDGGTVAVVDGPRFSSRAESRALAAAGGTVVNMTGMPEAGLARELALCFTSVALLTDRDAGVAEGESVRQGDVLEVFARSTARLRDLLLDVVARLGDDRTCACPTALDGTAGVLDEDDPSAPPSLAHR